MHNDDHPCMKQAKKENKQWSHGSYTSTESSFFVTYSLFQAFSRFLSHQHLVGHTSGRTSEYWSFSMLEKGLSSVQQHVLPPSRVLSLLCVLVSRQKMAQKHPDECQLNRDRSPLATPNWGNKDFLSLHLRADAGCGSETPNTSPWRIQFQYKQRNLRFQIQAFRRGRESDRRSSRPGSLLDI